LAEELHAGFISRLHQSNDALPSEEASWRAVCAFLEGIEEEMLPEAFCARVLDQLEETIGFDHGVAAVADKDDLLHPRILVPRASPAGFWDQYLGHFARLDPIPSNILALPTTFAFDTRDLGDTEFAHDFSAAMGNRYGADLCSLSEALRTGFLFSVYREGRQPFSPEDRAFLRGLYPHLRNLSLSILDPESARQARREGLSAEVGFSRRESEVAALLLTRSTTSEVAEALFISRRTVEKHVEHIFSKLRVNGRRAAFDRLAETYTTEPARQGSTTP
jgi:DNA-binding CsgD family transcriptional regulator